MIAVREYMTEAGKSPFGRWFSGLNAPAAVITQGNFANAKALGGGVSEYKIDFGPGYRIYFGKDGDTLVILLAGGSKKGQSADIKTAKENWADYKKRKRHS
jgi:putative addiction module killer protein